MAKILIVEDNETSRNVLARLLRKKGFDVVVAADGEAALAAVPVDKPDVVLMDASLPGLDGWETTRRLRKLPEGGAVRIIGFSGYAASEDRANAIDAGSDDYDTKPIDVERLLGKINALLARERS